VIWKLAAFLAGHGQIQTWQTLTRLDKTGQLPDVNLLLDYLFQPNGVVRYLCCVDDLHHLVSDPKYENLLSEWRQVVQSQPVQLILVSQQAIRFDPAVTTSALTGLTLTDTQALLQQQGITLEQVLLERLQERTEGNVRLLIYAIQALKRIPEHEVLIETLAATAEVQDFVLNLVDSTLNDDERPVMVGVAALLGWPGSADAIEIVSGQLKDRRILAYLTSRYLLQPWVIGQSTTYDLHDILRTFYYELLGTSVRLEMHRRATEYYTRFEKDSFKAALHACHARELDRAAELVCKDLRYHLHRGRAVALRRLLEQILAEEPTPRWLAPLHLALGQVYTFLEMVQPARDSFTQALDETQLATTVDDITLKAQVYREMGVLLRARAPTEALFWLRQGLDTLTTVDPLVKADLLTQLGIVQVRLGHYTTALETLGQAQQLVPSGINRQRLLVLLNLGYCYYYLNNFAQGIDCLQQALTMADKLGDPFNALAVRINLVAFQQSAGNWRQAGELYPRSAKLAQDLGNRQALARLHLNWGVLHLHKGEQPQALPKLQQALALARQSESYGVLVACLGYLAEAAIEQGEVTVALARLDEAETLATERKLALHLPFIYTQQARALFVQKRLAPALAYAERAISVAAEMPVEKAQALRVLGQIQATQQQVTEAEASFSQSLALLPTNPFERARTQVAWAGLLAALGAQERSAALWHEAETTFKQLGVQCNRSIGG
jgi:tetratricopeptide (TPR) repeat protein